MTAPRKPPRKAAALSFGTPTGPIAPPPVVEPEPALDPAPAPAPAAPASTAPAPREPAAAQSAPYGPDAPDQAGSLASLLAEPDISHPHVDGPTRSVPLGAFMAGRPAPDLDLAAAGIRLPRYILDALATQVVLSSNRGRRITKQELVADALRQALAPEIVEEAFRRHGGQPGESDRAKH